jgi:ABC-type polysaccharide/polyol phosphate export permease
MRSRIAAAIVDGIDNIRQGFAHWRVWHLLGIKEFRRRYRRSRLGQTWATLTTALFIGALGFTYSFLFRQPLAGMLPWVGIGVIAWNHLSAITNECTAIFAAHGPYYLNQKMVFSVSIISVIYRNAIILAHNMVIVVVLIIVFAVPVNWNTLALVPGLLICWLALLGAGYVLGIICTRFRDVTQLVANVLQIAFFVTPIMWKPGFLPPKARFIVDYNPFALFISLLRAPLLGEPVALGSWAAALAMTIIGGLAALWVIGRYERRVMFWV